MKSVFQAFSILLIALFLFASTFAQSQANTGLIQGTVTDPNGAVVGGANVTIKNVGTGFERTVTTNSDGFFSAPLLPLGKYQVTTEGKGFGKSVLENVDLGVGQTRNLDIILKVGAAVETVDVTAGGEGVAIVGDDTQVFQGGQLLQGQAATTALAGADTVNLRARLKRRSTWVQDEDGNPVPTFAASRITITD